MKPFLAFLAHLLFTFQITVAQQAPPVRSLLLATYTYDQNNRLENLQPLAQHLEQTLHQPVQVKSYASVPALLAAIRAKEVDIALLNTYGFLLLSADSVPVVRPLVTLAVPAGKSSYGACLFAGRLSGIQSLADLKSRGADVKLLLAGESSTSGHFIQRQFLQQTGLGTPEKLFKEVRYAQSHAQVVQQVKAGLFEVGACGLDELEQQLQNWQVTLEDITVLWTSDQIPLGPVVVHTSLPKETQQKLKSVFLQLHTQNPTAFTALQQGWTEAKAASHFQPANALSYAQAMNRLLK